MRYQITDLGLNSGVATDVNDRLEMAGNLYTSTNQPSGFYRDSANTVTMIPAGRSSAQAYARKVSAWGDVTGYISSDLPPRAFRWNASTGTQTLAFGEQSYGYGINSVGDVAGSVYIGGKERAFYWDRFGNAWEIGTLDASPLARTTAYAINDAQQVTGFAVGADGVARAFIWSPGSTMKVLMPGYQNSFGYSISNSGRIAGTVQTRTGWRAFIYDTKTDTVELYGPHNMDSTAYGIEYSGVAVGQSEGKAVLFLSLKAFDLNQYVEGGTPWTLTMAHAINRQGQIVVSGTLNGETRAFLLTPLL